MAALAFQTRGLSGLRTTTPDSPRFDATSRGEAAKLCKSVSVSEYGVRNSCMEQYLPKSRVQFFPVPKAGLIPSRKRERIPDVGLTTTNGSTPPRSQSSAPRKQAGICTTSRDGRARAAMHLSPAILNSGASLPSNSFGCSFGLRKVRLSTRHSCTAALRHGGAIMNMRERLASECLRSSSAIDQFTSGARQQAIGAWPARGSCSATVLCGSHWHNSRTRNHSRGSTESRRAGRREPFNEGCRFDSDTPGWRRPGAVVASGPRETNSKSARAPA